MDNKTERSISARIAKLNLRLQSPYIGLEGDEINNKMNTEAMQDALIALYDECNKEALKKEEPVAEFVEKFATTVEELKSMRIKEGDFTAVALIGNGNFGKVELVREKQTTDLYALKKIPKLCSTGQKDANSYEEERDILALAARPGASEWIPYLKYAFQDALHLYIVMEYLPGGDLSGLLDNFHGTLTEEMAKFYLAETLLAIISLHKMGYVHRDIKPDNILLDRCGHLKLGDFGSAAKLNKKGKVDSLVPVGTPEYIAPEVLQAAAGEGGKYGVECDFWSLGVVAFEMIYGVTPFKNVDRTHIYSNILAHELGSESLSFPSDFNDSKEFRQLVTGLLSPASSRLNAMQIKKHAFFAGTPWNSIRDTVPPYIPILSCATDVSNFNASVDDFDASVPECFLTKKIFSGRQLPFIGFSLNPNQTPVSSAALASAPEVLSPQKSKSEHPDVARAREVKTLKDLLKTKERAIEEAMVARREVENKLDQITRKANEYHKTILKERNERHEVESKALEMVKSMKAKWQVTSQQQLSVLNKQLETAQKELESSGSKLSDLERKLKNQGEQLKAEQDANSRMQALLDKQKSSISKARRETLSFMDGADKISELKNESARLQNSITELDNQKKSLVEDLQILKDQSDLMENRAIKAENEKIKLADKLEEYKRKLDDAEKAVKAESSRYERELRKLKDELDSSIVELEISKNSSRKEIALEKKVADLEKDVNKLQAEKSNLEQRLEDATSKHEEQQQKFEALEECMAKMEEKIESLEEENENLQSCELNQSKRLSIAATVSITTPTQKESNANTQKDIDCLKAQLEHVEAQLEKSREGAVLDRQACRTAQTDLFKKERELSDAKLDLRITQRELKTSESLNKTLQEEKAAIEKTLADTDEKLKTAVAELQTLKNKLQSNEITITKSAAEIENLRKKENELHSSLIEKVQELSSLKHQLGDKTNLATKLQNSLDVLKKDAETNKSNAQSAGSQVAQLRAQLESLKENNAALREICTEQEQQLDDSDVLRAAFEVQIEQGKLEIQRLRGEIAQVRNDLSAKIKEADDLRSVKKVLEETLAEIKQEAAMRESDAVEDIKELKNQILGARNQNEQLILQINELEETLCVSDRHTREQRQVIDSLKEKNTDLQEEISETLTDLQAAREDAEKIALSLEKANLTTKDRSKRIDELEEQMRNLKISYDEKIMKMEAQLAQQNKLIVYLQSKSEAGKKKRTLADKIFGIHPKENVAPSPYVSKNFATPMSAKEKARTWDCRPTPTPTRQVIKEPALATPATPAQAALKKVDFQVKKPLFPSKNCPIIMEQRTLPEYCRITINCAVSLAEQVTLLGTEEGLYSLHAKAAGTQLVHIAGINRVKSITLVPHLGIALFISGSPSNLHQCELRALTVAAEAAQCSKPSISPKPLEHVPDQCHLCVVSPPLAIKGDTEMTFLCVANKTHTSFLKWNSGSTQFEPIRLLATAFPASSALFTPQSLLLVCDDIFEVDLQDFSVEEFLDISDISLSSVRVSLKNINNGPVKLIDVTRKSGKAEPEFMLCLPFMAIFLDSFGHRSRPGNFKWAHKPLAFVYSAPSLFVQFKSALYEVKPNADKLCMKDQDAASLLSVDEGFLALTSPKLLGAGTKPGVTIATAQQSTGATTVMKISCQGAEDLSLTSDNDMPADEFSFTSSLEESLETEEP
ncbi:Hypothetical predicted protein [Cloeon dipterum]|uniref:non-specific serine/threonine protein kinase n=2 Tax=Cloeon dipterum TaxID=197152 RepID=A0A8S1CJN4_9INSE|nr:Hypothetical predicted protein [Cloeon dipterum]